MKLCYKTTDVVADQFHFYLRQPSSMHEMNWRSAATIARPSYRVSWH